jgi:hypothetical protein
MKARFIKLSMHNASSLQFLQNNAVLHLQSEASAIFTGTGRVCFSRADSESTESLNALAQRKLNRAL